MSLNIHISTVADEVRLVWVGPKYSTSTVFNFYCALSQEIFYYFKIMFPESRKTIFLIVTLVLVLRHSVESFLIVTFSKSKRIERT